MSSKTKFSENFEKIYFFLIIKLITFMGNPEFNLHSHKKIKKGGETDMVKKLLSIAVLASFISVPAITMAQQQQQPAGQPAPQQEQKQEEQKKEEKQEKKAKKKHEHKKEEKKEEQKQQ